MTEASHIDVSAVLAHVHMLETKLPRVGLSFGHPEPPQLYMSRIPDPDKEGAVLPVFALMAVSKRCISAQLVQEASSFAQVGPPVEVLVISGEDEITCAAMIPLELQYLTASDTGIDIDDEHLLIHYQSQEFHKFPFYLYTHYHHIVHNLHLYKFLL